MHVWRGRTLQGALDLAPGYYESLRSQLNRYPAENGQSEVKVVYTAMHGVGAPWFKRGFATFGLPPPITVSAQDAPDPNFPTVAFPNPEEDFPAPADVDDLPAAPVHPTADGA